MSTKTNCCICGTAKNCGKYLPQVFSNIEKIGSLFDNYKILIYYDKSADNTLARLLEYQTVNKRLFLYINESRLSRFRTHNIAKGRNFCLNYIMKNVETYKYFIMMDLDNVNAKNCDEGKLSKYLKRNDWDALSFQTSPNYYDIWGLSIYPFCFSYNHFNDSVKHYTIIQKYIDGILKKTKPGDLVPCISAFNGFAIYRTNKFKNTYYDGKVRYDLLAKHLLQAHKKITGSPSLQFIKYPTVDGRYEDCEHRAFHMMASNNNGAKLFISSEVIFF